MVGVGHEAGNRTGIQQDHATALEANTTVAVDVARSGHIAAFLEDATDDADHAPGTMIVDGRPLPRPPDQCKEREIAPGGNENCVSGIVFRLAAGVFGGKKTV